MSHRNSMRFRLSFLASICVVSLGVMLTLLGCSPNQSPDQLREKTAEETAAIKQDTKALAEGVKDGLSSKKSVDLNKASREDLSTLPGITAARADRIIAKRPYASTHQLVTRHVLSEDEYTAVQDRVVVAR